MKKEKQSNEVEAKEEKKMKEVKEDIVSSNKGKSKEKENDINLKGLNIKKTILVRISFSREQDKKDRANTDIKKIIEKNDTNNFLKLDNNIEKERKHFRRYFRREKKNINIKENPIIDNKSNNIIENKPLINNKKEYRILENKTNKKKENEPLENKLNKGVQNYNNNNLRNNKQLLSSKQKNLSSYYKNIEKKKINEIDNIKNKNDNNLKNTKINEIKTINQNNSYFNNNIIKIEKKNNFIQNNLKNNIQNISKIESNYKSANTSILFTDKFGQKKKYEFDFNRQPKNYIRKINKNNNNKKYNNLTSIPPKNNKLPFNQKENERKIIIKYKYNSKTYSSPVKALKKKYFNQNNSYSMNTFGNKKGNIINLSNSSQISLSNKNKYNYKSSTSREDHRLKHLKKMIFDKEVLKKGVTTVFQFYGGKIEQFDNYQNKNNKSSIK